MRSGDFQAALQITPLFYDAVLDPSRWTNVLGLLAEQFQASVTTAIFARYDPSNAAVFSTYIYPDNKEMMKTFLGFDDYPDGDPRVVPALRLPNRPLCRSLMVTDEDWYASPFYRNVQVPFGLDDTLHIAMIDEVSRLGLAVGFIREAGMKPFDETEADRLQLYVPHLRSAAKIMQRRFEDTVTQAALIEAFNEVELATLIVDRFATIQFANRSAKQLMDDGGVIVKTGQTLTAREPDANEELKQGIFDIALQSLHSNGSQRSHVVLPTEQSEVGLHAVVTTLDRSTGFPSIDTPDLAWAAVFLNDPTKPYETRTEQFQRLFGLTNAEADIAHRFAEGADLRALANDSDRTYETVRGELKIVMSKVGVTRQADLARVLTASALPLQE